MVDAIRSIGVSKLKYYRRRIEYRSMIPLASASGFMKNDRATDNATSTDCHPSREEAIPLFKGERVAEET